MCPLIRIRPLHKHTIRYIWPFDGIFFSLILLRKKRVINEPLFFSDNVALQSLHFNFHPQFWNITFPANLNPNHIGILPRTFYITTYSIQKSTHPLNPQYKIILTYPHFSIFLPFPGDIDRMLLAYKQKISYQ